MNKFPRTIPGLLIAAAFGLPVNALGGDVQPAPAAISTATFLVVYRPGPNWLRDKPVTEQPLKEHGRYLLGLYAKGVMKMAGPFAHDAGGAVILEASDEVEAKAIVDADPAVIDGVMIGEVHQWHRVPWHEHLKKAKEKPSK